jgi:hypothetical protein
MSLPVRKLFAADSDFTVVRHYLPVRKLFVADSDCTVVSHYPPVRKLFVADSDCTVVRCYLPVRKLFVVDSDCTVCSPIFHNFDLTRYRFLCLRFLNFPNESKLWLEVQSILEALQSESATNNTNVFLLFLNSSKFQSDKVSSSNLNTF